MRYMQLILSRGIRRKISNYLSFLFSPHHDRELTCPNDEKIIQLYLQQFLVRILHV